MATALDHAYNTTIDGDRTLHGLVWPGFVAISDDGEIRLAGFGLASGVLPSIGKPRLSREVAAVPGAGGARESGAVGTQLRRVLRRRPPLRTADGPAAAARRARRPSRAPGPAPAPPIVPEILAVLRMTLGPAESRYQSAGDLRRELGKLLFSGPYSPSTFNLALLPERSLPRRDRGGDAGAQARGCPRRRNRRRSEPRRAASRASTGLRRHPGPRPSPPPPRDRRSCSAPEPARRQPLALVGGVLAAAAIAGGIYVVSRRSTESPRLPRNAGARDDRRAHADLPARAPADAGRSDHADDGGAVPGRSVAARRARDPEARSADSRAPGSDSRTARRRADHAADALDRSRPGGRAHGTPRRRRRAAPRRADRAARAAPHGPAGAAHAGGNARRRARPLEELDTPPRIASVVKPAYPPLALEGPDRRDRRPARPRVREGRCPPRST